MIAPAAEQVGKADIFVIIGTSLNVYPAAGLINYAQPGVPIYLIDPKEVKVPYGLNITHIMAGATEGMKQLVEKLNANS